MFLLPMNIENEQEVISQCQQNDRAAQEVLYRHYSGLFYTICLRYTKSEQDAEQLLQDGFLKIFSHISQFEQKGSFEGWLKRIIINTCLDFVKSKHYKEERQTIYPEHLFEYSTNTARNLAIDKMETHRIMELVRSLSPVTQTVFNMYAIEGYSHKEIAVQMDISEGTSQWHVNNARKILREKLQNLILQENNSHEQSRTG